MCSYRSSLRSSIYLVRTEHKPVPVQLGHEELLRHVLPDVEVAGAAPGAGEECPAHVATGGAHQVPGVTAVKGRPWGSQATHHAREEGGAWLGRLKRRSSIINFFYFAHENLPR